nr:MAG TPA: NinB protein [Caudoviricetes sp.]
MIGTAETIVKWLFNQSREKLFEVKEHKEKRTLTQNAYMWSLINEIANKMRLSKEDTYIKMLKDYSQVAKVTVRADIEVSRFFKYYEFERVTQINGVNFNIYKVYEGSSKMDKNEFRVLLDGVIQEAQQLGICTLTPNEIERLRWIDERV